MAALRSSLDIFDDIGMNSLIKKSRELTGYLEYLIHDLNNDINIITPADENSRGAQLSIQINSTIKDL